MGGTVKCSGAAKIKPPFEMGVDNFEKHEDPAGDGNAISLLLTPFNQIEKHEDPAGDGNSTASLYSL